MAGIYLHGSASLWGGRTYDTAHHFIFWLPAGAGQMVAIWCILAGMAAVVVGTQAHFLVLLAALGLGDNAQRRRKPTPHINRAIANAAPYAFASE